MLRLNKKNLEDYELPHELFARTTETTYIIYKYIHIYNIYINYDSHVKHMKKSRHSPGTKIVRGWLGLN